MNRSEDPRIDFDTPDSVQALKSLLGRTSLLNEIHLQALPMPPRSEAPLIAICFAFAGLLFVVAGFMVRELGVLLRSVGIGLMLMLLLVLLLEMIWRRHKVKSLMRNVRPIVQEIRQIRDFLSSYLTSLDRRTSRYFHCVTNTKVTAYFMLRQIENALTCLLGDIEEEMSVWSGSNYAGVRELLLGVLEYRDGFEFNDGKLYYAPLPQVTRVIQELITELETGIELLEDEIRLTTERLRPVDDKQLHLPFKQH